MNKIILSFLIIFALINLSSFITINIKLNNENFCSACTGGGGGTVGGGAQINSTINSINVSSSNLNSSLDISNSNVSEVSLPGVNNITSSSKNKKTKRFLM